MLKGLLNQNAGSIRFAEAMLQNIYRIELSAYVADIEGDWLLLQSPSTFVPEQF